jgi:hypothetical protein
MFLRTSPPSTADGSRGREQSPGKHGRRAALSSLLAAVVVASGLLTSPSNASTVGGGIRTWTPLSEHSAEVGTVTRQKALSVARSYDLVTAHRATFKGHVPAMKQANKNLKVLVYTNAMFAQAGQGAMFPAHYYSYDARGQKVRSTAHGNYLMNPRSLDHSNGLSWAHERYRQCRNAVVESGYDGCFLDMLGTAPLAAGYTTSKAVDPQDGRLWTQNEYLGATSALANRIRQLLAQNGVGNIVVYGNGIGSGPRYFAGSKVLMPGLDAGIAESWLRTGPSSLNAWPTEAAWKQNVDMLNGGQMHVSVKTFGSGTQPQKDQWHKFALASFLLGSDTQDGFNFISSPTQDYSVDHPWWRTKLGTSTGAYVKSGAAYYRNYVSGKAVVNPTGAATRLALGGTYCGLDGFKGTSISLQAHSGDVLRKC